MPFQPKIMRGLCVVCGKEAEDFQLVESAIICPDCKREFYDEFLSRCVRSYRALTGKPIKE